MIFLAFTAIFSLMGDAASENCSRKGNEVVPNAQAQAALSKPLARVAHLRAYQVAPVGKGSRCLGQIEAEQSREREMGGKGRHLQQSKGKRNHLGSPENKSQAVTRSTFFSVYRLKNRTT